MFRKSLISLYFLADKLLLVQLARNKKGIKIAKSVSIPEGIISDNRVVDPEALAKILKSIWSKFGLKEKGVGIVLPEFSTYTKFFKIPELPLNELSEAVNWQAAEYLPSEISDLVMDWKVVGRNERETEVLIVAVDREILAGYVQSVESAGLFPLSVETPSVCLVRLTQKITGGVLIVYQGKNETILIVAQKDKIVGTSVLRPKDTKEIETVSSKMLSHYKNVDVKTVLVGGESTTESTYKIFTDLGLKVEKLEPKIRADSKILQEFLIPLSMQLHDPSEPSDPATLNLLPSNLVGRYKFERSKLQIWGLTLTITLFVTTSFLVTLGAYLFMSQQIKEVKRDNLQNRTVQERQQAEKDVQNINQTATNILAVKRIFMLPQNILNDVQRARPSGVTLNDYSLDLDKGEISLNGIASNRASLITFKDQLEANSNITDIVIPISSFEKETDLSFQIKFSYLPIISTLRMQEPARSQETQL